MSAKKESKKSDADLVRETAANPGASLAGTESVHETADSPLKVTVTDGARATLDVSKHEPLTQAELQSTIKLLERAVQETH